MSATGGASTTGSAKEKLGQASGQAQEKAQEKAQQLRGQASGKLRDQVDTRSTQAGEQVRSVADAVRSTGEQLRGQGKDGPAKAADRAADAAERLGAYLVESDADRILGDVQNFARRQPWMIAAGGAALGFVAARFVRASADGEQAADDERGIPSAAPAAPTRARSRGVGGGA